MGFIFSEVFWGVLLIIIGVLVVIKAIFHFSIPIFPIVVAFILIYGGIRILIGGFSLSTPQNMIIFNDATIRVQNPEDTYSVLFSKGIIDLTAVNLNNDKRQVNINTIFGGGVIRINPDTPIKIIVNSVFAEAMMPDGNKIMFGNITYKSKNFNEDQKYLLIQANVIFGGLEILSQ